MTVLIDTSAWIEALRPEGHVETRRAVENATLDGDAVLCDMVLLELWAGAGGAREQAVISRLAADIPVLPTDADVWETARVLARTCRAAGVTVPATDLLIAACAEHHGAALIERDGHFAKISSARRKDKK